jgi:hypothetical protein
LIGERRLECDDASPDELVLDVMAQSPDPTALVVLDRVGPAGSVPVGSPFAIGTDQVCGQVPGPSGQVPLYCTQRFVPAAVTGVPEGGATI